MNVITFPLHRLTTRDRAVVAAWDACRTDVLAWPHDRDAPDGGDTIEIIALETGDASHWIRRPKGTAAWVLAESGTQGELGRFRTLHEALDRAGMVVNDNRQRPNEARSKQVCLTGGAAAE